MRSGSRVVVITLIRQGSETTGTRTLVGEWYFRGYVYGETVEGLQCGDEAGVPIIIVSTHTK